MHSDTHAIEPVKPTREHCNIDCCRHGYNRSSDISSVLLR